MTLMVVPPAPQMQRKDRSYVKVAIVSNKTISGQKISIVPQFKYLGIIIDSNLSLKHTLKGVIAPFFHKFLVK